MKKSDSKRPAGRKAGSRAKSRAQHPAAGAAPAERKRASKAPTEARRAQPRSKAADPPSKRLPQTLGPDPTAVGTPASRPGSFPIVAIGASAGGLEALEQFLKNVPEGSGMAYVVIQHLDPTHKGAMVELLQRATPMTVVQVKDRLRVQPDFVYVIPPNKDMSILHGVLHLLPQALPRGLNLPIDFFFRSLAADQQERSIAVVLSGMGSDGTLGLRAIKEKAGVGFVQSVASAKFSGMPRSAIDAGLADVVAPVEELPGRIVAYHKHAPYIGEAAMAAREEAHQSNLEKVFILLRAQTGHDFSLYKRSTIYRRIERRMSLHQIDRIASYVRYLRENPSEVDLLFRELLIGVTSFFRDPAAWDHLKKESLPHLLETRPPGSRLRAWVPGCSTGEEAYSLAIVLTEAIEQSKSGGNLTFQIFASDLDREAIEKARQGVYPANIAADVSAERLRRFFVQDERGFRVRKEIREAVVFAPQNIIRDAPFTKLDVLSCRNLLIYLSPELQKKLIPLFHYTLNPGGLLFLGSAETVGTFSTLFTTLDPKARIYRRLDVPAGVHIVEFPPSFVTPPPAAPGTLKAEIAGTLKASPPPNLPVLVDRMIIQHYSPAAVLTNDQGDILYISGRTGKYLEPAIGRANLNVFSMTREGLRYELPGAFAAALREDQPVTVRSIKVATNGTSQTVNLTVQKINEPRELRGTVLIVVADVPPAPEAEKDAKAPPARRAPTGNELAELQRKLQVANEEIQTTREEMQTSQEELKSTNEEMQSTNEELQSTNEELTTSKEEMQSMNEELQTVNHELQGKVDELSRANNDMKNLLNSTDIATLFLDAEMLVRRFTVQTTKLIKLIPGDTGRPITDIASELDYPDLADDARAVLRTLVFKEKQVTARDGHWYTVRILPYRTLENVIDGVVITFTDVTEAKLLEVKLRDQADQLRQMAESLPTLIWGCRPDGACDYLSQQWLDYTGVSEAEQLGYGWLEQVRTDERDRVREEWKAAIKSSQPFNTEFRIRSREGAYRWFKTRSVPIRGDGGKVAKWYSSSTDVDDLKRAEERAERTAGQLASILEGIDDALLSVDSGMTITYFNAAAERLLERERAAVLGKGFFDVFPRIVGASLEAKFHEAIRLRKVTSFQTQLSQADGPARYSVRVYPHEAGISVFWQYADGPAPPSVRPPAPEEHPE